MPSFINTSYVNKMIYGQLLQKNEPENNLAVILSIILSGPNHNSLLKHIKIFAFLDQLCGIIEYVYLLSPFHSMVDLSNRYLRAWGAKYRSCSQTIDVHTVICEKPSKPLSIYECDYVNDCSDKSDETNCIYDVNMINYSHIGQLIYIPCEFNSKCYLYNSQSLLPIHHMCDGIYSEDIFVNEIIICKIHQNSKINLLAMATKLYYHSSQRQQIKLHIFNIFNFEMKNAIKQKTHLIKNTSRSNTLNNYERQEVACT